MISQLCTPLSPKADRRVADRIEETLEAVELALDSVTLSPSMLEILRSAARRLLLFAPPSHTRLMHSLAIDDLQIFKMNSEPPVPPGH